MKKGKFIVFEGGDKSGKTTQIELLKKYLEDNGNEVLLTREPGGNGSIIAEKIREIILNKNHIEMHARTELLLFLASRAQHVEEIVKPGIEQGKIVLCDRFDGSTFAYQGVARKLDLEEIKEMNNWAKDSLKPDLVIYVDITPEEVDKRRRDDKHDRLDRETEEFHKSVRDGFIKQAESNDNWEVVNGVGEIEDIAKNIQEIIEKL